MQEKESDVLIFCVSCDKKTSERGVNTTKLNSILRPHYGFILMTACWEKIYSVLGGVAKVTKLCYQVKTGTQMITQL